MTERGLPPDGAPACPFVAFEDDRDGRATIPDHRHRCFAEPRPAPRALAHQEAYCLSSAFPVCPTFQDWARREAAAARTLPSSAATPPEEAPESHAMPPLDREPQHGSGTAEPLPPRRNPPRDWAAPPPWTGEGEPPGSAAGGAGGAGAAAAAAAGFFGGPKVTSARDPFDDELPPGDDDFQLADDPAQPPADVPVIPPAVDQARQPAADAWGSDARGLAGSAAYRLAGPDPDEPYPAAPDPGPADPYEYPPVAARRNPAPEPARQPAPKQPPGRGQAKPASQAKPTQPSPQAGAAVPRQDASELFGPAWERPRRYEAYPTLRTRMGLPSFGGVPRIGLAALAVVLAAVFLFLFGPMLLGFGRNDPGGAAGPTPAPTASATEVPEPTTPPPPTPQIYTVKQGDTMSKVANKFGVTVEELLSANPQIKNPDRIKIGDKITIPVPVEGAGDGTIGESAAP